MEKKTYYGHWQAGSSYNSEPYEFTSLREARQTMREIARGNDTGSGATWQVYDSATSRQQQDMPIASGRV